MKRIHHHLTNKSPLYNRWHQNPHHHKIHWASLSFIFLLSLSVVSGAWSFTIKEQNILISQALNVQVAKAQTSVPAFPSCEGFGCETIGGRGGMVVVVTNLNDSGPGSLRDALMMTEPRIIVFKVSGTIFLKSYISLGAAQSYVTVAGQTAPGDGIALAGSWLGLSTNHDGTRSESPGIFHDGVFRYLRFRTALQNDAADSFPTVYSLILFTGTYNTVIDHNSFTWSNDQIINQIGNNIHDNTWSWNIIGEGSGQNTGSFFKGAAHARISIHHNYLAHAGYRNYMVLARGYQFINNVNYNTGEDYTIDEGWDQVSAYTDIINHYFKAGPSGSHKPIQFRSWSHAFGPISLYLAGNKFVDTNDTPVIFSPYEAYPNDDQWRLVRDSALYLNQIPSPVSEKRVGPIPDQPRFPVTIQSADEGKDLVLAQAGPRPLDTVDSRLLGDFFDGGGYNTSNIGKLSNLQTYNVLSDSDNDGMPDDWERANGLNPNAKDNNGHQLHPVYDNIEVYLASLTGETIDGVDNRVGDNCTSYASPGDNLSSKVNLLDPNTNHILCLRDGIYNDSLNITVSGLPGKPITIRAENDGMVTIDGQDSRIPCKISNQHDVILEGVICRNSSSSVISIGNSERVIVRRISAYNANETNNAHHIVVGSSRDILVEDCVVAGPGRTLLLPFNSNFVTFRRCMTYVGYAYYQNLTESNVSQIYRSSDVTMENIIGTVDPRYKTDTNYKDVPLRGGINIWAHPAPGDRNHVLGSAMYDLNSPDGSNLTWDPDYKVMSDGKGGLGGVGQISDNQFINNVSINGDVGVLWGADNNFLMNHLTIVAAKDQAIYYWEQGREAHEYKSIGSLHNSILAESGTGISTSFGTQLVNFDHSYNNLWNNRTPYTGTTKGPGELSLDPGFNTNKYGKGAYLMRPPNLKGKGENGSDIGAEVLYQYQDGVLTNKRLWPWPMEDRIMSELGVSVTWEAQGGLWKQGTDFNEVYTNNPAPDGSSGQPNPGNPNPNPSNNKLSPDLNCDNKVNVIDFGILLSWWGPYNGGYSHPNCSQ